MRIRTNKLFLLALLFLAAFAASHSVAETDYIARESLKKLERRVRGLEDGFSLRVLQLPGDTLWTEVPGWRTLELVPAGGAQLSAVEIGSTTARVVVTTSVGGGGSLSEVLSDGTTIVGTGVASNVLRVAPALLATIPTNFGYGLLGAGTTSPLSVDPGILFTDAPSDTNTYGRKAGTWVPVGTGFGTGDGSLAEFVATHTNSMQVTNSEIARLELVAGDNVLLSHVVDSANSSSVVRVSASSAIEGPQGAPGVGGLVYAGTYNADATYTNPATLVSFGRATYYTTNQWVGGGVESPTNTAVWTTFVPGGTDGSSGADGADGVGFNFLGPWSTNVASIGTNDCVSDGGQLFAPWVGLSPEGGIPQPAPNGVVNTNDYYVLVAKGADGASGSVSSNLFFAGDWASDTAYPEMSVVVFNGSAYYATEAITGPSYPLPGGAPWATFAARGAAGPKGDQGVDGVGNLQFQGFFDLTTLYPSNSVVAYPADKPDWYRAKALVSGQYPTATNFWEKILMSGLDASVFGVGYSVTYNPSTHYPSNHWLRHGGAVYASKQPVTGDGNHPPNSTYWELVVRDGTTLSTGLVWRGEWAAGTYASNDLVSKGGSSYFVNKEATSQAPPNTDWTLFVSKGDQGIQGPAGTSTVINVYETNITLVATQNVWNVTNNSYFVETNVYDTFLSYTSILNEVTYTNIYTNLGTTADSAYRGDWGDYVSNRTDAAYAIAESAASVAGATNVVSFDGASTGSYDAVTRVITLPDGLGGSGGTSTNDVRAIRDESFRAYTVIDASSGTGTITTASGLWLSLPASTEPRTLAMGTGFDAAQSHRFYVSVARGTNSLSIDTNLTGYAFLSLPVSSTNHVLIDRFPGDAAFRVLQVYR